MGWVRELVRRIRKLDRLNAEQRQLVIQEAEVKSRVLKKQDEIDREIKRLRQNAAYQEAERQANAG